MPQILFTLGLILMIMAIAGLLLTWFKETAKVTVGDFAGMAGLLFFASAVYHYISN